MTVPYHDPRQQCEGNTVARYSGLGELVEPSRRCKSKARLGRRFCTHHEPDREFNEARRQQNAAEEARSAKRHRQRHEAEALEYRQQVELRLARLARMTLVPDGNPHRCPAVGILVYIGDLWRHDPTPLPELTQCDSYVDHEGDHVNLEALNSYGEYDVKWR